MADLLRVDAIGLFADTRSISPSVMYYGYHFFYFLTELVIEYSTVAMLVKSPHRQHIDLVYRARWAMILAGMVALFMSGLVMVISVPVDVAFNAIYYATYIFYFLNFIGFILLALGTLPKFVLSTGIRPIEFIVTRKQRQEDEYLSYLHQKLVMIVSMVQLPDGHISPLRRFVEIAHARRIFWTTIPYQESYTALDEAKIIYAQLAAHTPIRRAGSYSPPPKLHDPKPYYLALAQHLKQLEEAAAE